MLRFLLSALVALPLVMIGTAAHAGIDDVPVAKIKSYQGTVEYSKDGETWRAVTRPNKYLLPGYRVRTSASSGATIAVQSSGATQIISASTVVQVDKEGIEVISGNASEPETAEGSFMQALYNKFVTSQRYTTVRRSVSGDLTKFATVRSVKVSSAYPDLVWENVGPGYSYRIDVGEQSFDVPVASTSEMIRFTLPELPAGEHKFTVSVVENGEVKFTPKRPSKLTWASSDEESAMLEGERAFRGDDGDPIELAVYQADAGYSVAALDTYRSYFEQYPDANEVRPMLAQTYAQLKLMKLKTAEAQTYQALLEGEG